MVESNHQFTINQRSRRCLDTKLLQFFQGGFILDDVPLSEFNTMLRKPRFLCVPKMSAGL